MNRIAPFSQEIWALSRKPLRGRSWRFRSSTMPQISAGVMASKGKWQQHSTSIPANSGCSDAPRRAQSDRSTGAALCSPTTARFSGRNSSTDCTATPAKLRENSSSEVNWGQSSDTRRSILPSPFVWSKVRPACPRKAMPGAPLAYSL